MFMAAAMEVGMNNQGRTFYYQSSQLVFHVEVEFVEFVCVITA